MERFNRFLQHLHSSSLLQAKVHFFAHFVKSLEFVQDSNFKPIELLNSKSTKHLVIFNNSFRELFNSKTFVKFATDKRHPKMKTLYIEHNLFYQTKIRLDVELQRNQTHSLNKHIVYPKSLLEVKQVATVNT